MFKFSTPNGLFSVESYGNGWAYTVTCKATGESFFVQDDSASQLQDDSADFANESVIADYMAALLT